MNNETEKFENDWERRNAKNHEYASCYVLIKKYKDIFINDNYDIEFIVRCIIGLKYNIEQNDLIENKHKFSFNNCLISLLNSDTVDVDKLDYLMRDIYTSGYSGASIDYECILQSFIILYDDKKNEFTLSLYNKVLSAIENVKNLAKAEQMCFFNHHSIIYNSFLIQAALKNIARKIYNDDTGIALQQIFNYDNLLNYPNNKYKLLCDDDIWILIKNNYDKAPEIIEQLFERKKQFKPIWKTFSEYKIIIENNKDKFNFEQFKNDQAAYNALFESDYNLDILNSNDKDVSPGVKRFRTFLDGLLIFLNNKKAINIRC